MFHKQIFQPAIDGKKNLMGQGRDDRWKFQVYNSTMAAFIVCCLVFDLTYYLEENPLKKVQFDYGFKCMISNNFRVS